MRIIGLGQAAAGDDGVGLAVVEWLRGHGVPKGVELMCAADDSALVPLLQTRVPVVLIDAVLGERAGRVLQLTPEQLATRNLRPLSTHGMGVSQVIELARVLTPHAITPCIRIVAVGITRPRHYRQELSRPVAAAVPCAGQRVLAMVGD